MKALRITALILTIVGGINWGLVGLFDFNLVAYLFGAMSILSRIIYILVGISAIIMAVKPTCSIKETIQHKMN